MKQKNFEKLGLLGLLLVLLRPLPPFIADKKGTRW